jgi:hypothetical protein
MQEISTSDKQVEIFYLSYLLKQKEGSVEDVVFAETDGRAALRLGTEEV